MAPTRLVDDPLARHFLSPPLRAAAVLARVPFVGRAVPHAYDAVFPGPRPSAVARTKIIDDLIASAVQRGAGENLIILGAGYDSRAYRLRSLAGIRIVEIDRAATQRAKRDALRRAGEPIDHVTFLALDFERDDLSARLADLHLRGSLCVLWEGVTNYLSADAVDRTFRDVAGIARAGGEIVFTYVHRGVIDGSVQFPEAARWSRSVRSAGEPWTFGFVPEQLSEYLRVRGFDLLGDTSTRSGGDPHFRACGRREHGAELYRVAHAAIRCRG